MHPTVGHDKDISCSQGILRTASSISYTFLPIDCTPFKKMFPLVSFLSFLVLATELLAILYIIFEARMAMSSSASASSSESLLDFASFLGFFSLLSTSLIPPLDESSADGSSPLLLETSRL